MGTMEAREALEARAAESQKAQAGAAAEAKDEALLEAGQEFALPMRRNTHSNP